MRRRRKLGWSPRGAAPAVPAVAAVLLGTGAGVVVGAGPAAAHAALESSTPAAGAVVRAAPRAVTLVFGEDLQAGYDALAVQAPDGSRVRSGPPRIRGATLTAALPALRLPGRYTVGYRVVSADGHPVSGTLLFRYAPAASPGTPAAATPAPAAAPPRDAPAASAAARSTRKRAGLVAGGWLAVLAPAAAVAGGGTLLLWWRRRA